MDLTAAMVEAASCLLCVVDVESGAIGGVNKPMQRLVGATEGELLGRSAWEVLDLPFSPEELRQVLPPTSAVRIPLAFDDSVGGVHERPIHAVWSGAFITDESGARTHLVLTGIERSGEFNDGSLLSHLMRAATATALVCADLEGRITFVSSGTEAMLGYTADELLGLAIPAETFESPDFLEAVSAWSERHETRDWNLVRKDGSQLIASVTVSRLTDGHGVHVGFLGIGQDVTTERRRQRLLLEALAHQRLAADRLEVLDRAKNDFISNMSHELRTPLTSISGYAELLLDGDAGPLTTPQSELLAGVTRNTERLTTLVNQLLFLATDEPRIFGGGEVVDLRDVVEEVSAEVSARVQAEGRRVELRLGPAPARVVGNACDLASVVRELVDNALKCTTQDEPVRCELAGDDHWVDLVVSDQGFGIPHREQAQVFDPFFRTSTSLERAVQGAGLGLTLVQRTVAEMGGELSLLSSRGTGTVFRVRLPRA